MKLATMLAAVVLAFAFAAPATAQQATPTLYKRLGGYDAVASVTDEFLHRLSVDPGFGRFFGGHSTDSLKILRQHVVDQLCAATGGPCVGSTWLHLPRSVTTGHRASLRSPPESRHSQSATQRLARRVFDAA